MQPQTELVKKYVLFDHDCNGKYLVRTDTHECDIVTKNKAFGWSYKIEHAVQLEPSKVDGIIMEVQPSDDYAAIESIEVLVDEIGNIIELLNAVSSHTSHIPSVLYANSVVRVSK